MLFRRGLPCPLLGFKGKVDFAADEAVVCMAFSAWHHSGVKHICHVSLLHQHIVNKVPVVGPRVHPGGLVAIFLLEDGVGDGELLFGTKFKKQAAVVIAVAHTMVAQDTFPHLCITANFRVEMPNMMTLSLGGTPCKRFLRSE